MTLSEPLALIKLFLLLHAFHAVSSVKHLQEEVGDEEAKGEDDDGDNNYPRSSGVLLVSGEGEGVCSSNQEYILHTCMWSLANLCFFWPKRQHRSYTFRTES